MARGKAAAQVASALAVGDRDHVRHAARPAGPRPEGREADRPPGEARDREQRPSPLRPRTQSAGRKLRAVRVSGGASAAPANVATRRSCASRPTAMKSIPAACAASRSVGESPTQTASAGSSAKCSRQCSSMSGAWTGRATWCVPTTRSSARRARSARAAAVPCCRGWWRAPSTSARGSSAASRPAPAPAASGTGTACSRAPGERPRGPPSSSFANSFAISCGPPIQCARNLAFRVERRTAHARGWRCRRRRSRRTSRTGRRRSRGMTSCLSRARSRRPHQLDALAPAVEAVAVLGGREARLEGAPAGKRDATSSSRHSPIARPASSAAPTAADSTVADAPPGRRPRPRPSGSRSLRPLRRRRAATLAARGRALRQCRRTPRRSATRRRRGSRARRALRRAARQAADHAALPPRRGRAS